MATRLYLASSGASPLDSLAPASSWNLTNITRYPTSTTKNNTNLTGITKSWVSSGSNLGWGWMQFTTPTLNLPRTITTSDTFSIVIQTFQGIAEADTHLAFVLRVVTEDGSINKGTLLSYLTTSLEFPQTLKETRIHSLAITNEIQCYAGDRLVLEVGLWGVSPSASSITLTIGDPTATADFALTSRLLTDLCPWWELSKNITFGTVENIATTATASAKMEKPNVITDYPPSISDLTPADNSNLNFGIVDISATVTSSYYNRASKLMLLVADNPNFDNAITYNSTFLPSGSTITLNVGLGKRWINYFRLTAIDSEGLSSPFPTDFTYTVYQSIYFVDEPSITISGVQATHLTVRIRGSSPVIEYTAHDTPETTADKRIYRLLEIDAGTISTCQTVAEQLISRWAREQVTITGNIDLNVTLDFKEKIKVIDSNSGINGEYILQQKEHNIDNMLTKISVGDIILSDEELLARILDSISGANTIASKIQENTNSIVALQEKFTPDGGVKIRLINKTGSASVKGTLVSASPATDGAFILQTNEYDAFGVVYEAGIADGQPCWIVISGVAEVLLKNSTSATRGYFALSADTDGRFIAQQPSGAPPITTDTHFKEIGHCIESKASGTDVLAKVVIHFN